MKDGYHMTTVLHSHPLSSSNIPTSWEYGGWEFDGKSMSSTSWWWSSHLSIRVTALIEPIEDKEHLVAVVCPHGQVHLLLSSNLVDMVDVMNKVDIDMVDVMKMVDMVDVVNPHGHGQVHPPSPLFQPFFFHKHQSFNHIQCQSLNGTTITIITCMNGGYVSAT